MIRILERADDTIVGTLQQTRNFFYVVPDDPRIVHNIYVQPRLLPKTQRAAAPGDKVVVRLESWDSRHVNPEGEIIELLGRATDPGVDMLSIIRKYQSAAPVSIGSPERGGQIPEKVDPARIQSAKICERNLS